MPVALNRLAAALRVLSLGIGLAARGISDNNRTLPSPKPINSSHVMLNPVAADVSLTPPFGWLKCRVVVPLALVSAIACGCRAQEATLESGSPVVVTHRSVPLPPKANQAPLWVALDDHLGRGTTTQRSGPLLTLNSAGQQSLRMRDGSGAEVAEARSLRLSWRLAPLAEPVDIARQIAGPFASFESAERIANRWRNQGVVARVAHPGDWEVWAPIDAEPLEGVPVRRWMRTVKTEMKAVLEGPSGGRTLTGPLMLEAPNGLLWQGGVLRGPFRLQPDAYGSWTLLEQVPLERYLEGVVPHEIGAGSPRAALEAQAVLARTWALANSHRFAIDGYHLCSDTQCQVYSDPRQASAAVRQAIRATSGQVLAWNGEPIQAWYHASNGGVMAGGDEAWAMDSLPYVQARADGSEAWVNGMALPMKDASSVSGLLARSEGAYGTNHPRFRWSRTYSAGQVAQALSAAGLPSGVPSDLSVQKRGASGRVLALDIEMSGDGEAVLLQLDGIRRTLRRLPSTLFVIETLGPDRWRFNGGGFGHGVGLSQAGAIDLAARGWSFERILSHYYPGTTLTSVQPSASSVTGQAP
ncbi:SpoIID/LytB domain protein [Synechococcus sp. CC9311]|nr:SpoIID/LytB domain protein [Synechococcus sp. CC9311]